MTSGPNYLVMEFVEGEEMPLPMGCSVVVRGLGENHPGSVSAAVKWCTEKITGNFHAGLEFGDANTQRDAASNGRGTCLSGEEQDWYEVMQLSPNADSDTIARVDRILAQRYNPLPHRQSGDLPPPVRSAAAPR